MVNGWYIYFISQYQCFVKNYYIKGQCKNNVPCLLILEKLPLQESPVLRFCKLGRMRYCKQQVVTYEYTTTLLSIPQTQLNDFVPATLLITPSIEQLNMLLSGNFLGSVRLCRQVDANIAVSS